jgi:cytoplasmic iron level regulating protein YaaA (DUF328/UPF0246 family)
MDLALTIIMIPPSEGKAPGGTGTWDPAADSYGHLAPARLEVLDALKASLDGERDPLVLGARGDLLRTARAQDLALPHAPVLAAHQRYTGVVLSHLDPPSLEPTAKERLERVVVTSALLGLVRLCDPVPAYRLRVGANLGLGPLNAWWRQHLQVEGPVLDLLTKDHSAMVDARERLAVRFERADKLASGHAAKAVKGLLLRHVLSAGGDVREALESFEHPSWTLKELTPARATYCAS